MTDFGSSPDTCIIGIWIVVTAWAAIKYIMAKVA